MRAFDADGRWWTLPCGPLNAISDVGGVTVGHVTLTHGGARTGVTAFGLLVAHAILSGLLLEPAYFAKFFRANGRLDGYVELP